MKITDQLVTVLNVGLQDVFFEVGLLTRLMEFPSDEDLEEYLSKEFIRFRVAKVDKLTGVEEFVDEIGEDEKAQISLKQSLDIVKVKNEAELLQLMNKRYKQNLKSPNDAIKFAQSTRNDVADIVQIDKVLEGLNRFGLSSKGRKEIEKIKDEQLTKICDLILVKVEGDKNE